MFTKFGGYADGLLKCVEWSKYDSFENPIWRTADSGHRPCTTNTTYRWSILMSSTRSHFFTLYRVASCHYDGRYLLLSSYIKRSSFIRLQLFTFLHNFVITHNKTAFVYKMATYGSVPFSLVILCHMQAIYTG